MLGEKRNLREIQETPCKIFMQLRDNASANSSSFFAIGGVKYKILSAKFL
jgi:hypothetical protein